MRLMWTEEAPDFDVKYYQLRGARCNPKPVQQPHPPFVIGGGGEKLTLRIVAQYASVWNMAGGPVEEFQRKSAILDEHCAAVGRDPNEIARSVQLLMDPDYLDASRATVQSYIEGGANHIILSLRATYPQGIVKRLAEEVVAPLHSA